MRNESKTKQKLKIMENYETLTVKTLECIRTGHVGVTPDHVYLEFYIDGASSPIKWPAVGAIKMEKNDSVAVNLCFVFENQIKVNLVNLHGGRSPEPFGDYTFTPEKPIDSDGKLPLSSENRDQYSLSYSRAAAKKQVTLIAAQCIKTSSAISENIISAVASAASEISSAFGEALSGVPDPRAAAAGTALRVAGTAIAAIPEVAAAIAKDTNPVDQFFITQGGSNPNGNKVYPSEREYQSMLQNEIVDLLSDKIVSPIVSTASAYSLWESDAVSSHDFMGVMNLKGEEDSEGYGCEAIVGPPNEGSIYLVSYQITDISGPGLMC